MTTLFPESLLTRWERGTSLVEEMGTDDPTEALKIIARWIRQETRGSDAPSSYLAAPAEGLPYREIGYTAEECERDMRKMTNGERGCASPDEHLMSRFTGHMKHAAPAEGLDVMKPHRPQRCECQCAGCLAAGVTLVPRPAPDTAPTDLQCGWCGEVFTHNCAGNWPAIGRHLEASDD